MKWLWFYIVCWKHRNDPAHYHMLEQYTLILKAARRCAYDLGHAANGARHDEEAKMYHDRHHMWLEIFEPDGAKDYKHRLHHDINNLVSEVSRLEKLCITNNVDHVDPNKIPF